MMTAALLLVPVTAFPQAPAYRTLRDGILVLLNGQSSGAARLLKLEVISDKIVHIETTAAEGFSDRESLMRVPVRQSPAPAWKVEQRGDTLILHTGALNISVSPQGRLVFSDQKGSVLLRTPDNGGASFTPFTLEGKRAYHIRQAFVAAPGEAFYGLGGRQDGRIDCRGTGVELLQHNSEAFIPFMLSSNNYGILWDNNSITRFGDTRPWRPLSDLQLYNRDGEPGGLTAVYAPKDEHTHPEGKGSGGATVITREENTIDYEFLPSLKKMPEGFDMAGGRVEWTGFLAPEVTGLHRLLVTSGGYLKLWIDGRLLADSWRQCWNPQYTKLDVNLHKGRKYAVKIDWIPDGGASFLSLKWKAPPPPEVRNGYAFASEAGDEINYYFVCGDNPDGIISGYRTLTGKAPVMPKWAMGLWQSRERYSSQQEILDVAGAFRRRGIPLDNIVQDWFYWKEDRWGSQRFDSTRYPDPGGMIRTLHDKYHTHFMISVWPKLYTGTKPFRQFRDSGWLYKQNVRDGQKDWVGYVSTFYDAFNPEARRAFWSLINKRLFSLGVDAWWLDATEPDILSNATIEKRKALMNPTALGSATRYFNAYALENARAVYNGQRAADPGRRVFILTRSAFAGIQRYAAANWSGDVGARWEDLQKQIAVGVSYSLSGAPYWTMDIGGFATEARYQHPSAKDLDEWREQMTRWFQFGAFCPLFRVHGQFPYREMFNVAPEDHPAYQSMLYYDKLRYRLMPYIYSLAGMAYFKDYTIMRGLVMDFPEDTLARDISDQYMFGTALLVNPVYHYEARSRPVYLPEAAGWYDLYSGKYFAGGQQIVIAAPYERVPVFVKAGSIVPFGPALQYTAEKPAEPLTLFVYTGADGRFMLYEDENVNYGYEKGRYSEIPFVYDEPSRTLRIGERKGAFPGMLQERTFRVVFVKKDQPAPLDFNAEADQVIRYDGKARSVQMKQPVQSSKDTSAK